MISSLQAHFVRMARNNLWSNHRLHAACARLSAAEYYENRASFFGSIDATLNHILVVDQVYLARLTDEDFPSASSQDREIYRDLKSLSEAQRASDRELVRFCDELDVQSLARIVRFTNSENLRNADPVALVLSHLFVHQIHHRGQVHNMLSATSVAPPQLDEFFLSGDRPRRQTELAELGLLKDGRTF